MVDLDAVEARARQALRQLRTGEVLALCRTLVAQEPGRLSGWLLQAVALFLDGRAETVYRRLMPLCRQRLGCDDILFLKDAFLMLAWNKACDAILAAAAKAPADRLYAIVPSYFAACVLLERRRFAEGFALLGAFRTRCLANLAALPMKDGDGFGVLFRHALLVNDASYLDQPYYRENLAVNRARLDSLHWVTTPDGMVTPDGAVTPDDAADGGEAGRAVLMVSCDRHYAELFLPRFLASVDRWCAGRLVHLHLIDPSPEPPDPGLLPALARNRLAISWERSGDLKCSAWYASARFVRVDTLLERYRRPMLLFDVDVALLHPPEALERVLLEADFGCFRMDRLDPGSVYQASVTAFRPSPAGLELAELLANLILSKMSIHRPLLWLIDQASLYSAITMLADGQGRLRVADFGAALGLPVEAYVEFCHRDEDKLHLMKLASGVTGATSDQG